jgi:hypothetical protein
MNAVFVRTLAVTRFSYQNDLLSSFLRSLVCSGLAWGLLSIIGGSSALRKHLDLNWWSGKIFRSDPQLFQSLSVTYL